MHKTSCSFGGCSGVAFWTDFQGILSYTFKGEAALSEELSPEENFFFSPWSLYSLLIIQMFWEHSKFQISKYPLWNIFMHHLLTIFLVKAEPELLMCIAFALENLISECVKPWSIFDKKEM